MNEAVQNYGEELKIVNRRCEYYVSKSFICSAVPYFEKLLSDQELESKENKVTLDFDERAFDALLNWIHTELFIIQMDYLISFYEAAYYLMIKDRLFEPCIKYFHENFTIEHLPVVLRQVTKRSKLINSEAIDSFICRHFLKIANTDTFLDYPIETLEHILKLDLMIYSEYQVFESIIKWVDKNVNSRKKHLSWLLKFVRWSFMDPGELEKVKNNELIKTLECFDSIMCSDGDCGFNRSKQNFFVSIKEFGYSKLRIDIFDKELFCLPIGDFIEDDSMSLNLIHEEHISDILFDTGRKGIRIDWVNKTFSWLNTEYDQTYYADIYKLIVNFQDDRSEYSCYLDARATLLSGATPRNSYLLLESNDGFVCLAETEYDTKYFGIFPVTDSSWFNGYASGYDHEFQATILDKVVYVFTSENEFFQFNMETRSYKKIKLVAEFNYREVILTSLYNDDKVILIDTSTDKFYIYCTNKKKWSEKYQILRVNPNSKESSIEDYELIAFTSTFLPIKNIKPLFRRNFNSSSSLKVQYNQQ